ncbi:hypothetical protein IJG72_01105 [bacterium]|nr:hypothetical protein [bacterium]
MNNTNSKSIKLIRTDDKSVDVEFYNNVDSKNIEVLDIQNLKFEGMKTKEITKLHIRDTVFKNEEKLYLQNNKSKIVAVLSKKHLNKIISTVFTKDKEGKYGYLKKEIISNVDTIFYSAIPILKHPELKKIILYDYQIIHRFALPLKIGGLVFFVMITVKERTDAKNMIVDEFTIYDLYSEACGNQHQTDNKKSFDSPSTVSLGNSPMTTRSQYRMTTYSINDLIEFVKLSMTKIQ